MNELEQILSRKRARKRLIYLLSSTVIVFLSIIVYFVVVITVLGSSTSGVDWGSWTNIMLASAVIITAPFVVLFLYEIYITWSEDRSLIAYCNEHPELEVEVQEIERIYEKKKGV